MADNDAERPDGTEPEPAEPDARIIADLGRQALIEKFGDVWLKATSDELAEDGPPPDNAAVSR